MQWLIEQGVAVWHIIVGLVILFIGMSMFDAWRAFWNWVWKEEA